MMCAFTFACMMYVCVYRCMVYVHGCVHMSVDACVLDVLCVSRCVGMMYMCVKICISYLHV